MDETLYDHPGNPLQPIVLITKRKERPPRYRDIRVAEPCSCVALNRRRSLVRRTQKLANRGYLASICVPILIINWESSDIIAARGNML